MIRRPLVAPVFALVALLAALAPPPAAGQITVDAPPSLAAAAARIGNPDLPSLRLALERAGLELPARIDVTLVAGDDPRAASTPENLVGLAFGEREIVIFPERALSYPYDSLESVLRHEVAHLALTARSGGQPLPRWFHEGVAVSVDSGWDTSAQLRLLVAMLRRPDLAELTRLFASDHPFEIGQAYLLSAVLVHDLRQRHGAAVPGAIAARVAAGAPFERAFRLETGESPDEAAALAWQSYRRWTAWIPAVTSPSAAWTLILLLAVVAFAAQRRRRARRRAQWEEEEKEKEEKDEVVNE